MSSAEYGFANILPPIGLILGSLVSAQLVKRYPMNQIMRAGISIATIGVLIMFAMVLMHLSAVLSVFLPMIVIYFGLSLVLANASTLALSHVTDKAHGSAVMNFLNMGIATVVVLSLSLFPTTSLLMPSVYILFSVGMMGLYKWLISGVNAK